MDDTTESAPEKDRAAVRAPRAGADMGRKVGSTPIQPLPSSLGAETIVRPSKLPTILFGAPPTYHRAHQPCPPSRQEQKGSGV